MFQAEQTQDELRPLRAFVGALNGYLGPDQSYAGTDSSAANPPRQFAVYGPQGTSLEGTQTQVAPAPAAAAAQQQQLLLIGAGLVAGYVLLKLLKAV